MSRFLRRAVAAVRELSTDVVLKAANLCDGHTILDPQAFSEVGVPEVIVKHLTQTHHSDGTHKGSLSVEGKQVEQVEGVYGLRMLEFLASALNVEYGRCYGRGSQARAIQQALAAHFKAA